MTDDGAATGGDGAATMTDDGAAPGGAAQRTLSIVKPDATARSLDGRITAILQEAGLRVVAARRLRLTRARAEAFYAVHRERPFFGSLVDYMTSGPVLVQVLEGPDAVARNRAAMGATDPAAADEGTIRARFGESIERNCVHGSDSPENAADEIAFFFPSGDDIPGLRRVERMDEEDPAGDEFVEEEEERASAAPTSLETVVEVRDGESFRTDAGGSAVRLAGLDPQERAEAKRPGSRDLLAALLPVGRTARVMDLPGEKGAYGRRVARVENHLGQDVCALMKAQLRRSMESGGGAGAGAKAKRGRRGLLGLLRRLPARARVGPPGRRAPGLVAPRGAAPRAGTREGRPALRRG